MKGAFALLGPSKCCTLLYPLVYLLYSCFQAGTDGLWFKLGDDALKRIVAALQFFRLELEAANAAVEKQEITELRRRSVDHGNMAFKAKPIARAPKPAEQPHLSTTPLTTPITPDLRTMRRVRKEKSRMPLMAEAYFIVPIK